MATTKSPAATVHRRRCVMKTLQLTFLAVTSALFLCGCKHYDYYLVEPAQYAQRIGKVPVTIRYAPMDYTLVRSRHRIHMDVANPSDAPVSLLADKSYVVDPYGRSHPVHGTVIAPHSFIPMSFPTPPLVYQVYPAYPYPYYGFYGPGWGWGRPFHHPFFYDDWFFYGPPPPISYSVEVPTPYNWPWPEGRVNLHLSYDQTGKPFDHHFIFDKREEKK